MTLVSHGSDVRALKTPGVDCICRPQSNTKLYKRLGLGMKAMRVDVNMRAGQVSKERYRRAYEVSGSDALVIGAYRRPIDKTLR